MDPVHHRITEVFRVDGVPHCFHCGREVWRYHGLKKAGARQRDPKQQYRVIYRWKHGPAKHPHQIANPKDYLFPWTPTGC